MNTFKHLQYQEAREFKENTQVILISLQRAGLVCILKQGKCELTIVLFCFCFVYWLPKICFVSNKVFKSLKMYEVTRFSPRNHMYCKISSLRTPGRKRQSRELETQTILAISLSAKLTTPWEEWKKRKRWAIYYLRISN